MPAREHLSRIKKRSWPDARIEKTKHGLALVRDLGKGTKLTYVVDDAGKWTDLRVSSKGTEFRVYPIKAGGGNSLRIATHSERRAINDQELESISKHHPEPELLDEFRSKGSERYTERQAPVKKRRSRVTQVPEGLINFAGAWEEHRPIGTVKLWGKPVEVSRVRKYKVSSGYSEPTNTLHIPTSRGFLRVHGTLVGDKLSRRVRYDKYDSNGSLVTKNMRPPTALAQFWQEKIGIES